MDKKNVIYTILMVEKLETAATDFPDFGAMRTVGYSFDRGTAFDWVKTNTLDISEHTYRYAIIEEVKEGLYEPAFADKRWIFEFDPTANTYHEIAEPKQLKRFCGFAIG